MGPLVDISVVVLGRFTVIATVVCLMKSPHNRGPSRVSAALAATLTTVAGAAAGLAAAGLGKETVCYLRSP